MTTVDIGNRKIEIAPAADTALESKLWNRWSRAVNYLPTDVDPVAWVSSAAAAANAAYKAGQNSAANKGKSFDVNSVTKSVFNAAAIGLPLVDQLGYAHLVPQASGRYVHIQLWLGYKGMLKLGRDAGVVDTILTEIVWGEEFFERWNDEDGPHFRHEPSLDRPEIIDIKDIKAAYCRTANNRGASDFEVVPGKQLGGLYRKQGNVWKSNPVEMSRKTAIRRMSKRWPQTKELSHAVRLDEMAESEELQPSLTPATDESGPPQIQEKPRWLDELNRALAECETAQEANDLAETMVGQYQDGADAIRNAVEGFLDMAGLADGEERLKEPEPEPEPTQAEVIEKVTSLFAEQGSIEELLTVYKAMVARYPEHETAIKSAASIRRTEIEVPKDNPAAAGEPPEDDGSEYLTQAKARFKTCSNADEVEAARDELVREAPAVGGILDQIHDEAEKLLEAM